MRRLLAFVLAVVVTVSLAACAARQLTSSEIDRLARIEGKIAEAERLGAKEAFPGELAELRAELDRVRHEMKEHWTAEESNRQIDALEKRVDTLLVNIGKKEEARKEEVRRQEEIRKAEDAKNAETDRLAKIEAAKAEMLKAEADARSAADNAGASKAPGIGIPAFPLIHFDFDQAIVREDAKPILAKVISFMKENPASLILVEGHCDERGTNEYNMALGQRRADAAMKYIVNSGIRSDRLTTLSFGEERPADPAQTESAWAMNRRGVLVLK